MKPTTTPATASAATMGMAKMMGVPKTPEKTSVKKVVGSTVPAETDSDDDDDGDELRLIASTAKGSRSSIGVAGRMLLPETSVCLEAAAVLEAMGETTKPWQPIAPERSSSASESKRCRQNIFASFLFSRFFGKGVDQVL